MRQVFQNGSLYDAGVRDKGSSPVVNFLGLHDEQALGNP